MKRKTLAKYLIYVLVGLALIWWWLPLRGPWFPRERGHRDPGTTHGWVMPVEKAVRV